LESTRVGDTRHRDIVLDSRPRRCRGQQITPYYRESLAPWHHGRKRMAGGSQEEVGVLLMVWG